MEKQPDDPLVENGVGHWQLNLGICEPQFAENAQYRRAVLARGRGDKSEVRQQRPAIWFARHLQRRQCLYLKKLVVYKTCFL